VSSSASDNPIVLTSVPTEPLAALLVGRLRNEGIRAEMSGVLTSAFRADAPGEWCRFWFGRKMPSALVNCLPNGVPKTVERR
jgi:hypothetical protein